MMPLIFARCASPSASASTGQVLANYAGRRMLGSFQSPGGTYAAGSRQGPAPRSSSTRRSKPSKWPSPVARARRSSMPMGPSMSMAWPGCGASISATGAANGRSPRGTAVRTIVILNGSALVRDRKSVFRRTFCGKEPSGPDRWRGAVCSSSDPVGPAPRPARSSYGDRALFIAAKTRRSRNARAFYVEQAYPTARLSFIAASIPRDGPRQARWRALKRSARGGRKGDLVRRRQGLRSGGTRSVSGLFTAWSRGLALHRHNYRRKGGRASTGEAYSVRVKPPDSLMRIFREKLVGSGALID
jgi:hypothetical protein